MTKAKEDTQPTAAFPAGPKAGERDTAFFDDPMIDHVLRAIITLAMEVSVSRERVRTLEALLFESGVITSDAANNFKPDSAEAKLRAEDRDKLITDILGPIVTRLSRPN